MKSDVQKRALDILEASLDLPEDEQGRFLAEAAAGDPELAAELQRLEPARSGLTRLISTNHGVEVPAPESAPPERIGAFRIGRMLGRGGMGTVYEGERADGVFEQRVAIKLLSGRHWTREIEQGLASERQILARLEHRNIARIYDGGVTPDGLSYIVMERIDGVPITDYADQHSLDVEARVRLFVQLTSALQFAHQQFIVHADVKPSNVLVSGDGSVKLLDFGIAALLDRDATLSAARSPTSAPMTRAYAAPERRAGGPATVAGDVYSAGAVLRDLLGVAGIARDVPVDLAAIVDRATSQDPNARYGNVAELRQDLHAWLGRLPVGAYRGGWRYRSARFVARNRVTAVVATLLFAGLSIATVVAVRLYVEAKRATAAESQRFEEARELSSFLVNDLSDQLLSRPGTIQANWQTLSMALVRLERLAASKPQDLALQLDVARNVVRIAEAGIGDYGPSFARTDTIRERLRTTQQRLESRQPAPSQRVGYWTVLADIAFLEAIAAIRFDGNSATAREHADRSIMLAERAERLEPQSTAVRTAVLRGQLVVAGTHNAAGEQQQAIAVLDDVQRRYETDPAQSSGNARLDLVRMEVRALRCDIKRWYLADDEALRDCTELEQLLRRAIAERGHLTPYESRLAYTLFLIASQLGLNGEHERALRLLDESTQIYARILYFGDNAAERGNSLVAESARAASLAALGRVEDARRSAAAVLTARRARLAEQPDSSARLREVATALRRVGEVELAAPDRARACTAFREAAGIWSQLERDGRLLAFDLAPRSGQVPWLRTQLVRCN